MSTTPERNPTGTGDPRQVQRWRTKDGQTGAGATPEAPDLTPSVDPHPTRVPTCRRVYSLVPRPCSGPNLSLRRPSGPRVPLRVAASRPVYPDPPADTPVRVDSTGPVPCRRVSSGVSRSPRLSPSSLVPPRIRWDPLHPWSRAKRDPGGVREVGLPSRWRPVLWPTTLPDPVTWVNSRVALVDDPTTTAVPRPQCMCGA